MSVREVLHQTLRGRPTPVIVHADQIIPAASLWVVMRSWIDVFRAAGVTRGAALGFAMPCHPAGLGAWLAAMWDDLSMLVPGHPQYASAGMWCAPGLTFDADVDRLSPRTPVAPSSCMPGGALASGVHDAAGRTRWDDLVANAPSARQDSVTLASDQWFHPRRLRDLTHALLTADVVELRP